MSLSPAHDYDESVTGGADAAELFMTPQWQGQIQQIVHLAEFTGDIQVIQGPLGSGKTSLISLLSHRLPREEYVGCVTAAEGVVADVALSQLLSCLGLPTVPGQQRGKSIVALRKYVQQLHQNNLRRIVIIDDAHYLDDSILGSVASVMQGSSDQSFGLHLILFSQHGVAERFDGLGFIDISVHDIEMIPFSLKETGQFLDFVEPGLRSEELSASQINQIWTASKGLPGEILEQAHHIRDQSFSGLRKIPWFHIAAVLILSGVLGCVAYYKGHDFSEFNVILNSFKAMFSDKTIADSGSENLGSNDSPSIEKNTNEIAALALVNTSSTDEPLRESDVSDEGKLPREAPLSEETEVLPQSEADREGTGVHADSGNSRDTLSYRQADNPSSDEQDDGGAESDDRGLGSISDQESEGSRSEAIENTDNFISEPIDTEVSVSQVKPEPNIEQAKQQTVNTQIDDNIIGLSNDEGRIGEVVDNEEVVNERAVDQAVADQPTVDEPAVGDAVVGEVVVGEVVVDEVVVDEIVVDDAVVGEIAVDERLAISETNATLETEAKELQNTLDIDVPDSETLELKLSEGEPSRQTDSSVVEPIERTGSDSNDRLSSIDEFVRQSEARLLAYRPIGFVIQVLAARPETPLLGYLKAQANNKDLMMYRGLRSGKPWFVVVEGYYHTKEEALAAMGSLPREQIEAGPWSKPVQAVQLEIKAAQQQ